MRHDCRKGEACGRMPGRKGPAAAPELSRAARCERKLAIEGKLERQIFGARHSHGGERPKSRIAQVGTVCATSQAIGEST